MFGDLRGPASGSGESCFDPFHRKTVTQFRRRASGGWRGPDCRFDSRTIRLGRAQPPESSRDLGILSFSSRATARGAIGWMK
jgi:hypothetical protein